MIGEISAGYASLKTALDIAKGLNAANTQVQINEAKIALQQLILDAQQSLSLANESQAVSAKRISELEKEIADLKAWDAEAEKYELKEVSFGAMAYVPKPDTDAAKTAHWLCANCFEQKKKSYLQISAQLGSNRVYKCRGCDGHVAIQCGVSPSISQSDY